MMYEFEEVEKGVYYLGIPCGDTESGITLIKPYETGEDSVLIDTGATEKSVYECIQPALKQLGMTFRDICYMTVTHCHPDNMAGLRAIKREAPGIKILVPKGLRERMQNPMRHIMEEREVFPEHNPVFKEIGGVIGDIEVENGVLELEMIPTPGHDIDCVCWLHTPTGTLIVGDALQGNGNSSQGAPFYKEISKYLSSLNTLSRLSGRVKCIISARTMDGIKAVEHGADKLDDVIKRCRECVTDMGNLVQCQLDAGVTDIAEIAAAVSVRNFERVPPALCYAMYSVSAHIREGVLRNELIR